MVESVHHGIENGLSVQRLDELEAKFTGELPETAGDAGLFCVLRDTGAGLDRIILKTSDGGETWELQISGIRT